MSKVKSFVIALIQIIFLYILCAIYNFVVLFAVLVKIAVPGEFSFSEIWNVKQRAVPKVLSDEIYGQHKFAKVNGIKLHYVEKGNPNKPLMLFIHGFPEFWYSWRHQINEFSKDYWTVAIDMRGYGDSDKPRKLSDYRIDRILGDIKELLKYLGREKCILVGHDWGAAVGFRFVLRHMDMIDRYIMIGAPSVEAMKKLVSTDWDQFTKSWYTFFFQMVWFPEFCLKLFDMKIFETMKTNAVTDDDIEVYKFVFSQKNALTAPLDFYRANARFMCPGRPIKKPKKFARGLYLLGEHEKFISKKSGKVMMDYYENLDFQIIKGASHFAQQDMPDETNRLIREFLNQQIVI